MGLTKRLFIKIIPGKTFLDKLSGTTKVRFFLLLILLLIVSWDLRVLLAVSVLGVIGMISVKPNWPLIRGLTIFMLLTNLFNLFLIWLTNPNYGADLTGGCTVLLVLSKHYFISAETLFALFVRFMKFMSTFLISLCFIQCITPSEMAAGLYSIKVPYKVCTVVSLAFRYIPDIARDFENIKVSMQARGMELDSKKVGFFARLKQNILILMPLIISSFDRIGNIANAMDLRGFGKGKKRTYYSEHEETKQDKIMKVCYLLTAAGILAIIIGRIVAPPEYKMWKPW